MAAFFIGAEYVLKNVTKALERSLFIQQMNIRERNRGRRLKGQEKLAHTLALCHTIVRRVC
ncbi:hypothetical protein CEJ32_08535 [Enterobacter sp. 9-2]|nr:hypothetical protein CEJ32_08535 [Enterobacter sp. 9-2]